MNTLPFRRLLSGTIVAAALAVGAAAQTVAYVETPSLQAEVAAGRLPAVAERLPATPMAADAGRQGIVAGRHGGDLRMLFARPQDTRLITVIGYARLVILNPAYEFVPDILESVTVEEGRVFTFKLRRGHRWSDGHPFT
ncbi:MAG: ABC transporter substrate-binding protein, partial [Alphaproteobacteria bacterium]|nr:ABC transporter substrate-binding protein [Alphaproteobacteria bacterium]